MATPYTYLDPALQKFSQGGNLGAYSVGSPTGGSVGSGMPTAYDQPLAKVTGNTAKIAKPPATTPDTETVPSAQPPTATASVQPGAVPPPPPPPPPTPNTPPSGVGAPGDGSASAPQQGVPYVAPTTNAGAAPAAPTVTPETATYNRPPVYASAKAPTSTVLDPNNGSNAGNAPAVAPTDWNAVSARAATTPPPATPPVTKPLAAPGSPKPGDPGYSPVLDPNSPDYDPILAAQLAARNAPPATDGADSPTGTGGNAGNTPPPATGGSGAGAAQQPTAPSLNPNDYTPGKTAADPYLSGQNADFAAWLKKQMDNPSPYSDALIQQGQQTLQDGIARQTAAGLRQIEELYASRGLTGSSLEATAVKDFLAQMEEQYRQGSFALGQAQVAAYQQQETTVGNLGLGFGQNLTAQQQNALASIRDQMSLALQKYGYDKASADAAANRQLQKEISDNTIASNEKMQKRDLLAQYGQAPTPEAWDSYAATYGKDAATADLGPRPTAKTTTPTTGTQGTEPSGTNQYPPGTQPSGAPTNNPAMNSDIYNYQGINAGNPDTAPMRLQRWDDFSAKYGADAAQKYLGPRPGPNTVSGLTPQQTQNWLQYSAVGQDTSTLAGRQAIWDGYAQKNGTSDATSKLGPRPTA